jgi:hypothetical protein
MALGSSQPLTEMSTRNLLFKKRERVRDLGIRGGRRIGLTTLPSSISCLSKKYGQLDLSRLKEPPQPVTGISLPYMYFVRNFK